MNPSCPYQIKQEPNGYLVVRLVLGGGYFPVAGPYNTRYEAEQAALWRWAHGNKGRRAA